MTTRGREQTQFARQLSSLRSKAHLSRERLADLSEVSIHSVHSWEQGRAANPTLRKVCRLAQALGVTVSTLLEGVEADFEVPADHPEENGAQSDCS